MGGMRTFTQREAVGDFSSDTIVYHQTLVMEDPIIATEGVPELIKAAKAALEASEMGNHAGVEITGMLRYAIAKVKTE